MILNNERIELGCHTKMSQMYGIDSVEQYIDVAIERGCRSIGITDINNTQSFITAQNYLDKNEIKDFKIIYGIQTKFAYDENINKTYNIIIYVKEQKGLKNLYTLLSNAYLNSLNEEIVIYKSQLDTYRDGLLYGSSVDGGEIDCKLNNQIERICKIARYYDFLQIVPKKEMSINKQICKIAEKESILVIASSVPKFINKNDSICSEILNYNNNLEPVEKDNNKYMYTTKEMLKEFEYLGKEKAYEVVVKNTHNLSDIIEIVKIVNNKKHYPQIENATNIIKNKTYKKAHEIYGDNIQKKVKERLDLELNSIIKNGFESIYILASEIVNFSIKKGYKVGIRGSVGDSLVAFLLGITEYNPLTYDLQFEVFAGGDLNKEPDIDLNISPKIRGDIEKYLREKFGENKIFYCGTIAAISNKTAEEMINKYSKEMDSIILEREEVANKLINIKKGTGVHPGGLIILDKKSEITDFCPTEKQGDKIKTHLDYHELCNNLFKFDILSHNTPTILYRLEEKTGIDSSTISLQDEEIMRIFLNDGDISTMGIPDFGTNFLIKMLKKVKPKNINELICISCLAHGSGTWNYNAEYLIEEGTAGVSEVISNREDIMKYLMSKGIDRNISYDITKFLWMGKANKKETNNEIEQKWSEYKNIMEKHCIPEWFIKSCTKIKYLFPKSHAIQYAIHAVKIAWYKVHYPKEFYETYFETTGEVIDIKEYRDIEEVKRKIRFIEEKLENEHLGYSLECKYREKEEALKVLCEMLERGIHNKYLKKDDVYEIINSRAVGDYCREIKHEFNTEEIAVLIFRNRRMSIEDKIAKYKELINNYPDMEVIERINCKHYNSVKEMIQHEIDRLNTLKLKLKTNEDDIIYTYTEYNKSTNKKDYYNNFENTRKTFQEVYKLVNEYIEEYNDTLAFDIKRKSLKKEKDEIIAEYVVIDKMPILVNIIDIKNNYLDIDNIFLNIPTPFKKGDILVELGKIPFIKGDSIDISDIFVLDWLCTWVEGLEETLKRGNHDSSDMCATGYYICDCDSDEFICDHKFDYDNFEYFNGKLEGVSRILTTISNLKKGKIDIELFVHSYEQIKRENSRSHVKWYSDETLKLAGFSEEDIKKIRE